jgi:UDP-3-O-[3-hydroxymyristoyl] glucosamine N-acyltransferase
MRQICATAVIDNATVTLGEGVVIGPHTSLRHCVVGAQTTIGAGTHIGGDGFGFTPCPEGQRAPVPKPQTRRVRIGSNVWIGALCTIDRGSWRDTEIGDGCKIDSQVHVGHNVHIDKNSIVCGATAIGGCVSWAHWTLLNPRTLIYYFILFYFIFYFLVFATDPDP